MMDTADDLRDALRHVPAALLDAEDETVRADALVSLDIYGGLKDAHTAVVLVGPSGVGKSWLFNALMESSVSPTGLIRPTTTALVAASIEDVTLSGLDVEVQRVQTGPSGMVLIDTPAWEHQPDDVIAAAKNADIVVLVVSPTRYADASVAKLWGELGEGAVLVLNRCEGEADTRASLVESVSAVFGCEPAVVRTAQVGVDELTQLLSMKIPHDDSPMQVITLATARSAARHVAQAAAAMASEVQRVSVAVAHEAPFIVPPSVLSVSDSWLATKQSMGEAVMKEIRDGDERIVASAGNSLADRLLTNIGIWDDSTLDADLDAWKERCRTLFRTVATIRWRRGPAEHLIANYSWKVAVNAEVVAPRRFKKILRSRGERVADDSHEELVVLLAGSVEERRRQWEDAVDALGEYQPGKLFTLVDRDPRSDPNRG